MIILRKKKLEQIFTLLYFLSHVHRLLILHLGLTAGNKFSQIHLELVCPLFDLDSHTKDAFRLNILGIKCCDLLRTLIH